MTGTPREIDCHEALDRLYEYFDGELTADRAAEVQAHLERCAPCLAVSTFESAYLRFLEARARAMNVPPTLRKRVLENLLFEPEGP
jgi:anti-sigma factor (TIGR02949 family)